MRTVVADLLGESEMAIENREGSKNAVAFVTTPERALVVKTIERSPLGLAARERAMRAALEKHTSIAFPRIVADHESGGATLIVMERTEGTPLLGRWRNDPSRARMEAPRLGEMLAEIHSMPTEDAGPALRWPDDMYGEAGFDDQLRTLERLVDTGTVAAIQRAHSVARRCDAETVVCHSDFGPHQVLVTPGGQWTLIDFEFAGLGPYADDVAGTEIRMLRAGLDVDSAFRSGYFGRRGESAAYDAVAAAFQLVMLALLVSFRADRGQAPDAGDVDLLTSFAARFPGSG